MTKVLKDLLEMLVLVFREFKVLKEIKVLKVKLLLVLLVFKVFKELKVTKVFKVRLKQEILVFKDHKVLKDLVEILVEQDLRVQKAVMVV